MLQGATLLPFLLCSCWQVQRSPNGTINSDPSRFPGGMKALADYIHSKGLKFGPSSRNPASRSVRRALLTPQVKPGSRYRCSRST